MWGVSPRQVDDYYAKVRKELYQEVSHSSAITVIDLVTQLDSLYAYALGYELYRESLDEAPSREPDIKSALKIINAKAKLLGLSSPAQRERPTPNNQVPDDFSTDKIRAKLSRFYSVPAI